MVRGQAQIEGHPGRVGKSFLYRRQTLIPGDLIKGVLAFGRRADDDLAAALLRQQIGQFGRGRTLEWTGLLRRSGL